MRTAADKSNKLSLIPFFIIEAPKQTDRKSTPSDNPDFPSRFGALLRQLNKKNPDTPLPQILEELNKVVELWSQQSPQIQQSLQRQILLQALIGYLELQTDRLPVPARLRVCRAAIQTAQSLRPSELFETPQKQQEPSSNRISPKQALCLARTALEHLNKLTQSKQNDKAVAEAAVMKVIFELLAGSFKTFDSRVSKLDKKPLLALERKNSIKKLDEIKVPERPRSKGRLPSVSKKELPSNPSARNLAPIAPKQEKSDIFDEIILYLLCIVKNFSANEALRKKILEQKCLGLLNKYVGLWNEKNITNIGSKMLVQITSAHRHLAADEKSYKAFQAGNTFEQWTRLIVQFPNSNDTVLNILRVFSKLSTMEDCCKRIYENTACVRNLCSFFKIYKANIHIVIRVAYIFANMTSFLSEIRTDIYFKLEAFPDIYSCFDYYVSSQLLGKSEVDKMGISVAAWDYQMMKKESDIEALVKIIRLLANLFTVPQIGSDIYINRGILFKDMIKKLKQLIEKKSSVIQHTDLIYSSLSCMANALYYDKEVLMSNLDYKTTKTQLVIKLGDFIVQTENQEVCCEGLRVLSNLSRMKDFVKQIVESKLHEATLILLESSSKQIVYYSLGVLINLLSDTDFKCKYKLDILKNVLSILSECDSQDFDIIGICLRCLGNITDGGAENIDGPTLKTVEETLLRLGDQCDHLMVNNNNLLISCQNLQQPQHKASDKVTLQESRKMINLILNNLPEDSYVCTVAGCGRKFPDEKKLKDHMDRRHKLS